MRKTSSLFNSSNSIFSVIILCNENNLSEVLSIRFFHGTLWLKEFHEVNALNFWKTKRYTTFKYCWDKFTKKYTKKQHTKQKEKTG